MATPTAQTAAQLIADSLLQINVIRVGQTPTADQHSQCIRRLNQMMAAWYAAGIRLGYIPVGTATDTLTVDDGAILGIMTHLAIHIASSFGATVSQELIAMAERGMAVIEKLTAQEILASTELQPSADTSGGFNMQTG